VDHADVRVIQRRGGPGLGEKTLPQLAVFRPARPQELERHVPLQLVVVGEVDQAEAAFSQDFLDAIATNALWYRFGKGINWGPFFAARVVSTCSFEFIHGAYRPSPRDSLVFLALYGLHRPPRSSIEGHFNRTTAESHDGSGCFDEQSAASAGARVKSGKGSERRTLAGLRSRCTIGAVRQFHRPRQRLHPSSQAGSGLPSSLWARLPPRCPPSGTNNHP